MKNIILLTGRGGSKSIASKNVYPVLGRPLAFYPINAAKKAKKVDEIFVSTDCNLIRSLADKMGINIIDRPDRLSEDRSELIEAINHAVEQIRGEINYLITMHCNCGVHKKGLIDECIEVLDKNEEADSCVSGYIDYSVHPFRTKKISERGYLRDWLEVPSNVSANRQSLEPCFVLDGAVRVMRYRKCFPARTNSPFPFLGDKITFVENAGIGDVHSLDDIALTERFLRANGWNEEITI